MTSNTSLSCTVYTCNISCLEVFFRCLRAIARGLNSNLSSCIAEKYWSLSQSYERNLDPTTRKRGCIKDGLVHVVCDLNTVLALNEFRYAPFSPFRLIIGIVFEPVSQVVN